MALAEFVSKHTEVVHIKNESINPYKAVSKLNISTTFMCKKKYSFTNCCMILLFGGAALNHGDHCQNCCDCKYGLGGKEKQ
jgi:hypothetical protein